MPNGKRDVEELKKRAINSLVLGIELFNRPHENGRVEGTLILLHHSFEMLLKSIIVRNTGTVFDKGKQYSYGFDKCLNILQTELNILTKDAKATLSILDAQRDTSMHYYSEFSEDMLYVLCQASVTLFDELLNLAYGVKLARYIPSRILPISARPPRDIQLLVENELQYVDELLAAGSRKGAQAAARLRSIMPLATASRDNAERVTEAELKKAIQRRRTGEEWKVIFPEIAQLILDTEGSGIVYSLRIGKKGLPVRYAAEGEEGKALLVKKTDWFEKYCLSLDDLSKELHVTQPKLRAYMFELNLWADTEMYAEKKVKSQLYKRYTTNAKGALRAAIQAYSVNEIWEKHKSKVLAKKKK